MIKLVIFDWNGTLIADAHASFEADNNVLRTFGGKPVNMTTWRNTIIIPSINFYELHGCNRKQMLKELKRLGNVFHEFYETRVTRIRTRSNGKLLLNYLFKSKIDSIIVSNHTLTGIQSQLKRLKIEKYLSSILANTGCSTSMKNINK